MKNRSIEIFARIFTAIGFFSGCYLSYEIMYAVLTPMGFDFHKSVKGQGFSSILAVFALLSIFIIIFTSMLALFFWFLYLSKVHRVPKYQLEQLTMEIIKRDPSERLMLGIYKWILKIIYG